jgi:N-acetylglucosaminyl-diphospho-decaprenol L-rhamnosyltransferase
MNITERNIHDVSPILVSISIISHGQIELVSALLDDLSKYCDSKYEVLLTLNVPEQLSFDINSFPFALQLISNEIPKGFAENQNAAFSISSGKFYCVMNPDIRLNDNPFPSLINCFSDNKLGVVAPKVTNPEGKLEDSARPFPTPITIIAKAIKQIKRDNAQHIEIEVPDWVGGMFMLFKSSVFKTIKGFDERYFLYYEDVDLCARLKLAGYDVKLCPDAIVVHDAQRGSHRDLKYLFWHLSSMTRFFMSRVFFKVLLR